ncbi:hypothetical protein HG537_0D00250 [Torulaspora globosa]|uniref:Coatomer subunit delta n=1 Tax=Torulaspora globosa TaxID=48254 RepID=A0A7H9HUD1_9SACH|nr:hypothetical protein HG537_0D00250 [Torulaspora sp. CBS 2947]
MVVLAASITTRAGKPLLSRQFTEISKDRVLELLSNFQSLVTNILSEHTFVEDEHVRYVYRPFDDYYIILITNRQSNIIMDLSTLNLFSQTVNHYLSSFDEAEIYDNAFEILSSFDEIVVMGYKENLSITQVNTYLSLESHEERIQEIIERNKEFEATEERKRRAKEIARREQERKMGIVPSEFSIPSNRFMASDDPNVGNAYNSYYSHASAAAQQSYIQSHRERPTETNGRVSSEVNHHHDGRGMKLAGQSKRDVVTSSRSPGFSKASQQDQEEEKPINNGILISIKETVNAEITRDGAINSSELKGVLELRVNDKALAHAKLALDDSVDVKDRSLQFKTHPNIDKNEFLNSKIISLRDNKKAFPSNDQSLGVLRWRKVGAADDKTLLPLEISTWVSPSEQSDGVFDVTVEFEVNENYTQTLNEVLFTFPVFTENVSINADSNEHNATIVDIDEDTGVTIKLESIAPATSGVFAFTIEAPYEDGLFPINVDFKHSEANARSVSGVSISNVTSSLESEEALPYDVITSLKTEEYIVI